MADLPDYYTQAQISEAEAAKFKGGLDANKSATPVSRDIYLATDTLKLYVCIADGTWTGFDASILVQGILTLYANMVAGGYKITGLGAPTAANDAARKAYVDAQISGDVATHAALVATHGVAGTIAGLADIATHAALTATHGVAGTIAGLADIATHAALAATHGRTNIDGVVERNAAIATHTALPTVHQDAPALITTHAGLTTGIHGVGASTIASVANIATHAALTATHGVAGTIAGLADIVSYIATHAALTATHGVATIAGLADIATHAALTATHGVAGTIAGLADIATHAALTATHGVTGAILGTTDTQNISNKTLAGDLAGGGKQITALDRSKYNETNLLANGDFEVGDPPTGWIPGGTGAVFSRSTEQVKIGTYSFKITYGSATAYAYRDIADYTRYKGRNVICGMWIYATVANRAIFSIEDGVTPSSSAFHSGAAGWEWITLTKAISSAATYLRVILQVQNAVTSAYFDGAILVEGDSCPAFSPMPASKEYTDAADALRLLLAGGTMSGNIAMGTNKVTGMGDPTAAQDAATKNYVDIRLPSGLIVMWHGTIANIPSGYVICDGNSFTPNLLAKFVEGVATAATDPGATGGNVTHTHTKSGVAYKGGDTGIGGWLGTLTTDATDGRPPYYDVAFIMKT